MVNPYARQDDEKLRELVARKLTASQIGRELGRSKSSVVSRIRRLGLKLAHAAPQMNGSRGNTPQARLRTSGCHPALQRSFTLSDSIWRPKACQFIAGQPSTDESCKCGAPVQPGSAYCREHHRLTHMPAESLEDAA